MARDGRKNTEYMQNNMTRRWSGTGEYIIVIPAWGACVRLHRLLLVRLKAADHSVFYERFVVPSMA